MKQAILTIVVFLFYVCVPASEALAQSCPFGTMSCRVCVETGNGQWGFCRNECESIAIDPYNCGGCGIVCTGGNICFVGQCVCPVSDPTTCNSTCVNTQTDALNCGTCGTVCGGSNTCVGGTCTPCGHSEALCGGFACTDLQTDPNNCGACNSNTMGGNSECIKAVGFLDYTGTCTAGACTCDPGMSLCLLPDSNGAHLCTATPTAPSNCGGCGASCSASEQCYSDSSTTPPTVKCIPL